MQFGYQFVGIEVLVRAEDVMYEYAPRCRQFFATDFKEFTELYFR
jgi:hypothetical protein